LGLEVSVEADGARVHAALSLVSFEVPLVACSALELACSIAVRAEWVAGPAVLIRIDPIPWRTRSCDDALLLGLEKLVRRDTRSAILVCRAIAVPARGTARQAFIVPKGIVPRRIGTFCAEDEVNFSHLYKLCHRLVGSGRIIDDRVARGEIVEHRVFDSILVKLPVGVKSVRRGEVLNLRETYILEVKELELVSRVLPPTEFFDIAIEGILNLSLHGC
jgi:hypothetical protein